MVNGDEAVIGNDDGGEPSLGQQAIPVLRALSKTNVDTRALSTSPKMTTVMMRRCSEDADGRLTKSTVPVRANIDEMWQHLRHLGPSNRANNPKNTRSTTVKIKQGHSHAGHQAALEPVSAAQPNSPHVDVDVDVDDEIDNESDVGETTRLLANGNNDSRASSGALSRATSRSTLQGYGTTQAVANGLDVVLVSNREAVSTPTEAVDVPVIEAAVEQSEGAISEGLGKQKLSAPASPGRGSSSGIGESATRSSSESSPSHSTFLSVTADIHTPSSRRSIVRSGSITENVIETHGIRKVVLETTKSAEKDEETTAVMTSSFVQRHSPLSGLHSPTTHSASSNEAEDHTAKKKEIETALLAAVESGAPAQDPVLPVAPESETSSSQVGTTTADDSEIPATANNGSGGQKKKNRRKKRKNHK